MIQTITILALLLAFLGCYWLASGRRINIGSYLLAVYVLSVACSLFIDPFETHVYSFAASFLFLGLLLLFLLPVLGFNSNRARTLAPVAPWLFNGVASVFIVLGVLSYVLYFPTVLRLFLSDEALTASRSYVVGGETNYQVNALFYGFAVYWQFYPVVIAFYFYSITQTTHGWLFNGLLLFASTSYIMSVLLAVGRDGFVLWAMSYLFAYLLFRRFLTARQRRWQRRMAFGLGLVFVGVFGRITASRHLVGRDYEGLAVTTVSYIGMQFGNFNNFYNTIAERNDNIYTVFPLLRYVTGEKETLSLQEKHNRYMALYNVDVNVFATFLGDLWLCIDPRYLAIGAVVYGLGLWVALRAGRTVTFGKLLAVVLVGQVPLHGVFYNKLMYSVSDIYVILTLILAVLFSWNWRRRVEARNEPVDRGGHPGPRSAALSC